MKFIPQIMILVLLFSFTSCKKNSTKSDCNCGTIVSQGFHSWAEPGYWKVIKNDCTGISATFYFRTNQGTSIGDHFCLSEGTTW